MPGINNSAPPLRAGLPVMVTLSPNVSTFSLEKVDRIRGVKGLRPDIACDREAPAAFLFYQHGNFFGALVHIKIEDNDIGSLAGK